MDAILRTAMGKSSSDQFSLHRVGGGGFRIGLFKGLHRLSVIFATTLVNVLYFDVENLSKAFQWILCLGKGLIEIFTL